MTTQMSGHYCAMDHTPIWHNDSEHEQCPLCRMRDERDAVRQAAEDLMDEMGGTHYPANRYVDAALKNLARAAAPTGEGA
jgi:hypothetical protein